MKVRKQLGILLAALAVSGVGVGLAFSKDARTVKVEYTATVRGTQLPAGQYEVNWVAHSPEATVSFSQNKNVVATTEGKWVERSRKYDNNSVVYSINPDGSRAIAEIRFAGMNQALTFDEPGS